MLKQNLILISSNLSETRCAVIERGRLAELHVLRFRTERLLGNVYWAKVVRVLPGMQAAFVDIGESKNGFLHVDQVLQSPSTRAVASKEPAISSLLREGQLILVQVVKEPRGDKGPVVSMNLSLAGSTIVFFPFGSGVGVSQKISNSQQRSQIQQQVEELVHKVAPQRVAPHQGQGGFVVRTQAQYASAEQLANEVSSLGQRWQKIVLAHKGLTKPALVGGAELGCEFLVQQILSDNSSVAHESIIVDDEDVYKQLTDIKEGLAQASLPRATPEIQLHLDSKHKLSLFDLYAVEEQIQASFSPKVALDNGANLVFDIAEAMCTIDVNTASFVGRLDQQKTLLATNLAASEEIARQIRLRNLSGIIMVDFIDLSSRSARSTLSTTFKQHLSTIQRVSYVSDVSELGLIEISRRRVSPSLQEIFCVDCPQCAGSGSVKSLQTVAYEVLRAILKQTEQEPAIKMITIVSSEELREVMQSEFQAELNAVTQQKVIKVGFKHSAHYKQHEYDIVLAELD